MELEYLNSRAAASYLQCSTTRIFQLVNAGRLGRLVGGYWLFTIEELDRYIAQRATRPLGGRPRGRKGGQA